MKNFLIAFLLGLATNIWGQSEEIQLEDGFFDLGINVTSALSSFSGNGNFLEASDLPAFFRFGRGSSAIRVGIGGSSTRNEFFDNISQTFRNARDWEAFLKLGIEKRIDQFNRWDIYGGLDMVSSYARNRVFTNINFNEIEIIKTSFGIGASPFVGIKFALAQRLYLSTELNLSYMQIFEEDQEFINGMSSTSRPPRKEESTAFIVNPPLFLYLNYVLK